LAFGTLFKSLFLSPELDIVSRKLSIGCSLFPSLGRTSFQKSGGLGHCPIQTRSRDKRRCRCRLQCRLPSRQPRLFHECPVSLEVPLVPIHRVHCVDQPLFDFFGIQDLSAKQSHLGINWLKELLDFLQVQIHNVRLSRILGSAK